MAIRNGCLDSLAGCGGGARAAVNRSAKDVAGSGRSAFIRLIEVHHKDEEV